MRTGTKRARLLSKLRCKREREERMGVMRVRRGLWKRAAVLLLCAALAATGCPIGGMRLAGAEVAPSRAERALAGMTAEEKICQLFIVRPEALCAAHTGSASGYSRTSATDAMLAGLADYPVGGVALFAQNLESPEQLARLVGGLQAASDVPLFVAVDEEGGRVARLASSAAFDVPRVGAMGELGARGDLRAAYEAYRTIGAYLSQYGFNLDFAPVADVNTNPANAVIGDRSFGGDPALVAEMVLAGLGGLHNAGVMGCVKHFPGHGDTAGDTHAGHVTVTGIWEELLACELVPFVRVLDAADMVMVAHIAAPNVTGDGLPASLSPELIRGKLRDELGYGGVVITDALEMGAITGSYSSGEAALLALQAGADVLLMPGSLPEACGAIRAALDDGAISEARLDESVLRILRLKEKFGLL